MPRNVYIIGIDEAGRGPLAGPVVVAGVRIKNTRACARIFYGIRDSKKLSAKQREEWFSRLTGHPEIEWASARISPAVIDKINIYQATLLGARRVYEKLSPGCTDAAVLDGSLYLPRHIKAKTIIKGDEKIPVISAASIIAKVTRDRIMLRLHKEYPQYGFDRHKGYGTRLHYEMVREFGRCRIHRQSFRIVVD